MELYVQMGHNMQSLALEMIASKMINNLIISPLNMTDSTMISFGKKVNTQGGKLLLDPQLYYPRKYQKKLACYNYWPREGATNFELGLCDGNIQGLIILNEAVGTEEIILPSYMVEKINAQWNAFQESVIKCAKKHVSDKRLIHTISLKSSALNCENVDNILSYSESWSVEGIYIVCEHPANYYLVDNPLWLSNLLDLVAGLKRQKKSVIVGYASHQMLCLAAAKCDGIASGNFLNVRWFKPDHFETIDSKLPQQRSVWYYCPQALSEFKITYLDLAKRMDILDTLKPSKEMMNENCEMLFSGALPTATGYKEANSHRHYLLSLSYQCRIVTRDTYAETKNAQLVLLETAESLLKGLRENGVRGQDRDFSEMVDVNRGAIAALDKAYGFPLSKEWKDI